MRPTFLVYFDESGNTGLDFSSPDQPVFLLGALVCPAENWPSIEAKLRAQLLKCFPGVDLTEFEVHAHKLLSGTKPFRAYGQAHCLAFQRSWFEVAAEFNLSFFYRSIEKRRFSQWLARTYGAGVHINPHAMAFPLVALVVNEFLREHASRPLGIFISDENQELTDDLEKSVRLLRGGSGRLKLDNIIEKCFFIDSQKSLLLQLCDLCAYSARKREEAALGRTIKPHHQEGINLVTPLIRQGDESLAEVIEWMTQQIKKRPGTESGVS